MAENPNVDKAKHGNTPNGNPLADDINNAAHDAGSAADSLLDRAANAAHAAEGAVEKTLDNVGEALSNAGSELARDAGTLVDDAGNTLAGAGKTIHNAGEAAYDTGAKLVDNAGQVINDTGKIVVETGSKMVDGAGNVIHDAAATAAGVGLATKKAAATAINKTGHAIDDTTIAAQRAAKKAARDAQTLADRVADRADNIKWLVIALLVLVLAAAAVYSYITKNSAKRSADAQNMVFKSALEMQGKPEADAMKVFGKAAQDFKGLPAGQQARLYQFAYAFNTGKYAESEQAAREFVKDYPGTPMANRASLALGQALMQQGKLDDAISGFQALTAKNDPETFAEAKLALAQALERNAENVADQPAEYRRRLEMAEQEYTDIISRANISNPVQRGYWPQSITLPADYALVQIKDKLAGHTHSLPRSMEAAAPVSQRDLEGAQAALSPADSAGGLTAQGSTPTSAEVAAALKAAADATSITATTTAGAAVDATAGKSSELGGDIADAVKAGTDAAKSGAEAAVDTVKAGAAAVAEAADRAKGAVTKTAGKAENLLEGGKPASSVNVPSAGAGAKSGQSESAPNAKRKTSTAGASLAQVEKQAAASLGGAAHRAASIDDTPIEASGLLERVQKALDTLRGYAVSAIPTTHVNHIPRVVASINAMNIGASGSAAPTQADSAAVVPATTKVEIPAQAAETSPDGIISVRTDVDHAGEEYVKASEAGM